jgi:prefoldin subunit 5
MKKLYSFLLLAFIGAVSVHAQIHLFLEEQVVNLGDSRSSAWVFPVAHDLELALGDLQDYCKDRSDLKLKKGGENILMAEIASVPSIATKRGDLIGKGFITETYYGLALIFQMGYDISLNSVDYAPEMKNFRNYAKEFMSYHYEKSFTRRVVAVEKQISDLEKEKGQGENKIGSANKRITNLNKKIAKETGESKISQFKAEIEANEMEITSVSSHNTKLQEQIDQLKGDVQKLKEELNKFQANIADF